jgi:hypothetical protein
MLPGKIFYGWAVFALVMSLAWGAVAEVSAEDPLVGLIGDGREPMEVDESRLNVTLLRMKKADAARLLLEDVGGTDWEERLVKLKEARKLELMASWSDDDSNTKGTWGAKAARSYRFLAVTRIGRFWDLMKDSEAHQSQPPDFSKWLNEVSEREVGSWMKADFEMVKDSPWVDLNIEIFYDPFNPLEKPSANWPMAVMSNPKLIFRQWHLRTEGRVASNRVFFIGAQMDALNGEKKDWYPAMDREKASLQVIGEKNDDVLLAFGKVVIRRVDALSGLSNLRLQTWTLALEARAFLEWILQRKNAKGDALMLEKGLAEGEVLATGAVMLKSGEPGKVGSDRSWEDITGLEPSSNPLEFRPRACESEQFGGWHRLVTEMKRIDGPVNDNEAKTGRSYEGHLKLSRPSVPSRFLKWKTAMDREDASDPWALEITEGDVRYLHGGSCESFKAPIVLDLGEVAMVNAGLKDGRVHVAFVRLVEDGWIKELEVVAHGKAEDHASRQLTCWVVETPQSGLVGRWIMRTWRMKSLWRKCCRDWDQAGTRWS